MDNTGRIALAAIIVVMLCAYAHAISSDQVVSAITGLQGSGGYLDSGEAVQLLYSGPVDLQGEQFWLVYTYVSSQPDTRNVIFAVSDNTGQIVTDPNTLSPLFTFVYQSDLMSYLSNNKESLADFQNFLANAQNSEQSTNGNYYKLIRNQIATQYPSIDFSSIETALTHLETAQQAAITQVANNQALLAQFDSYPNTNAFDTYYKQFNVTTTTIFKLSDAVDAYHNALFQETQTVSNSASLNYSDKQTITTALENLYNVGDYVDFKSSVLEPSQTQFNSLSNQIPQKVNQSVQSSIYRIARKDAQNADSSSFSSQVQTALNPTNLAQYSSCGVSVTDLQTQWSSINGVMSNPTNATPAILQAIPAKVTQAQTDLSTIQTQLTNCQQRLTAQAPKTPSSNNSWVINVLIIIIVLALAYVGYTKWKKSQEEQ